MKTYEAIVKGESIPEPGIPESFKVLLKELQSLGLDAKVLTKEMAEIEIKEAIDEGDDLSISIEVSEGEALIGEPIIEDNPMINEVEDEDEDEEDGDPDTMLLDVEDELE